MDDNSIRATIVHEAGHAVMAAIHGLVIEHVTIFPEGHLCQVTGKQVSGQVQHVPVHPGPGILPLIGDQALALRCALMEIRIMTAGMLAESVAFGVSLEQQVSGGSSTDWKHALEIAQDFHEDEADQISLVRRGCVECLKILRAPPVWAAVQALSEHLREFGRADGGTVREIVARHVRHGQRFRL